jgi:HSP20 family protein
MATQRRENRDEATLARRSQEWDPFQTMRELMAWDPFRDVFPRLWRGADQRATFVPAFDVRETKDAYLFAADLPGFREQDVDINVTGNRLSVSGKREAEHVEESDRFYACERTHGTFTRSFTLPEGANPEQVHAELKDGVLTLRVPKSAEAQPKKIAIKVAKGGGEKQLKS